MGKGDQKTRRGKIFAGSYGARRKKNKRKTKHLPAAKSGVSIANVAVSEVVAKPEPGKDPIPVPIEKVVKPVEVQEIAVPAEEPKKKVVRKKPAAKKDTEQATETQAE